MEPRQPLLTAGLAAWAGGGLAWGAAGIGWLAWLPLLVPLGWIAVAPRRTRPLMACVVVGVLAGATSAAWHLERSRPIELRRCAEQRCELIAAGAVKAVSLAGGTDIGERVRARVTATLADVRVGDEALAGRYPVVLLGDAELMGDLQRGSAVVVRGDLLPMSHWREPGFTLDALEVIDRAAPRGWSGFVAAARADLWTALDGIDPDAASLIAGLAIGDDSRQSETLGGQMRAAGLSHLLAVSGGNIAIILGVALAGATWAGASRRSRVGVGLVAVIGYAAFVGPEPSVLRATLMGAVAILGMLRGSARAGLPVLGLAILALVVASPGLVVSWGFALSVAATGGILTLAAPLRGLVGPGARPARLAAGAAGVTLAAQAATAPLLAAMTGTVSLAAVPANLLAAPLVAPITLLGLATLAASVVAPGPASALAAVGEPLGALLARIAAVAAGAPMGSVPVPGGMAGGGLLTAVLLALWLLWRRWGGPRAVAAATLLAVLAAGLTRPPGPPADWIAGACDVGQGDAFLIRTGAASAILIDTGPDSSVLLACLDDFGVDRIDLLVISHYDTDHVAGVPAVLRRYRPPAALLSPVHLPADNAETVHRSAERLGVAALTARPGQQLRVGDVSIEVVWPRRVISSGSVSNNAAVATAVRAGGLRMLFTGDLEPLGQAGLMSAHPADAFDLATIPHHGSANQDPRFLRWTGARLMWVSAGRANRYGHPRPEALRLAAEAGAGVGRTDRDGSLALVVRDGRPALVAWDRPS